MLVRILNALRRRIWDMVFFLFSGYSKSAQKPHSIKLQIQECSGILAVRYALCRRLYQMEIDSSTDTDLLILFVKSFFRN
ncbi:hypothetical protein [Anaerobutyricum soehngenii]|uniref:hypothetical protein n=1 Tax=Anaerobutyricum soehngenii TaxID=105843 RepID=UPI0032BFA0E1